ncbi:MAG: hypothetical protein NDI90_04600 [Nitrospira sp. BO4]|jgi:hypothetical protein|nr:hypothetical protein [Nitrospira sp. BO4]
MAQRFNKEPINLIHRIPSQKQIDEARPTNAPYGQLMLDAVAVCWRKAVEFFARVTRYEEETPPPVPAAADPQPISLTTEQIEIKPDQLMDGAPSATAGVEQLREAGTTVIEEAVTEQQPAPALVQPEEVAELRAFLLGQQEDIARLSTQIQELKSLVVSQQQVLVHLGKELEAGVFSAAAGESIAASAKRNRVVRKKPILKDKPIAPQESEGPSLNL